MCHLLFSLKQIYCLLMGGYGIKFPSLCLIMHHILAWRFLFDMGCSTHCSCWSFPQSTADAKGYASISIDLDSKLLIPNAKQSSASSRCWFQPICLFYIYQNRNLSQRGVKTCQTTTKSCYNLHTHLNPSL